jgi:hypothetical protein
VRDAAAHNARADYGNSADLNHPLRPLFQLLDHANKVGVRLAHVLGEAVFFHGRNQIKAGINAPQGCGNIVDVIHHANQFTGGTHKNPPKIAEFCKTCGTCRARDVPAKLLFSFVTCGLVKQVWMQQRCLAFAEPM